MSALIEQIHTQAVEVSGRFKKAEADLIEVLQRVEEHQVFIKRGHSSLYAYVTGELGLAENTAYSLITVARKAREVPALKEQIQAGEMTLSNARRVAAVLTPQNQDEWIKKACDLSARQLEKEIVRVKPEKATPERVSYTSPSRTKLELGLSEQDMLRLRRAQDLLSQSRRRAVSLEETLSVLTSEFLHRHDPNEKAKRHRVKKSPSVEVGELVTLRVEPKREPIPAAILPQVNFRDQRSCTHLLRNGKPCGQTRWIEIHHKIPVSGGGANTLENLTTLCSAHHRFSHSGEPREVLGKTSRGWD